MKNLNEYPIQEKYSLRVNGARIEPQKRILRLEEMARKEEPLKATGVQTKGQRKNKESVMKQNPKEIRL